MDALAIHMPGAVLVVDDNADVRALVARVLRRSGFMVCEAPGGVEALEVLASESVAVILSDVHMPGMSGVELMVEARMRAPLLPFFLMTADQNMTCVLADKLGADGFFPKPLLSEDLLSVLRKRLSVAL